MGAPLAPYIFATDAMGNNDLDRGGFGIVGAKAPPSLIEQAFELGTTPGRTISSLDGDIRFLKHPEKEMARHIPYSPLPSALFDETSCTWEDIDWGRWLFADHVTLGE